MMSDRGACLEGPYAPFPYQTFSGRRLLSSLIMSLMASFSDYGSFARYEGVRGFYRGIMSNLFKNLPVASVTFVVYESVIKLFIAAKEKT